MKNTIDPRRNQLDEFVVMPNHFTQSSPACGHEAHGVLKLTLLKPPVVVIRSGKSAATTHQHCQHDMSPFWVWQRNYYEHVIRNRSSLNEASDRISRQIPRGWADDSSNWATAIGN
ncbi:MAG: hypothetical protein U0521_10375 [Anaerolineae bacterium]